MKLRVKDMKRLSYGNVAKDVLFQRHFTDLDYLTGFRDANNFVNVGICKCKIT